MDDSFVWLKPTQTEGKDQCNTAVLASGDVSGHLSDHQKSRKFSVLSVPLVTNRHSQWTVKIRQKSKNFRPKSFLLFLKFRAKTINFFFVLQNSQSIPWLNEKIRPNQPQFRCPEEDPIPDVFFSMALIMEKSSVPHRTSNKKKSR